MPSTVFGLPTHPLIVHAVVVLVPLAALAGLLVAVWPAARARYAPHTLVLTTVVLISNLLAMHSGDQLKPLVQPSAFVDKHVKMGDSLIPFVGLLWLALIALVVARSRAKTREVTWTKYVTWAAAVVATVGAIASGVQVVRIGDSGARAAWHGVATSTGQVSGPHH